MEILFEKKIVYSLILNYFFCSVLDVSHNRIDDPEVLEVFASMENLVKFFQFLSMLCKED